MAILNAQGLPLQLILQPDKNVADLAKGLSAGTVLRGRVNEVLADGKAVVSFRGISVTAELKGVQLARGEVISVSVQDLKGTPVFRLIPQAVDAAGAAAGPVPAVPPSSPLEPAIASLLSRLQLPQDNFHGAIVQLLQGYSVEPSRASVAAVKDLLATIPAFLGQAAPPPVPQAPAAAPTAQPVAQPQAAAPTPAPVAAPAAAIQRAVPAPVPTAPGPVAALQVQSAAGPASIIEPTLPATLPPPPVLQALDRGYMLGRLLAELDVPTQAPPATPAPTQAAPAPIVRADPPVPVPSRPAGVPVAAQAPAPAPASTGGTATVAPLPVVALPPAATPVANALAETVPLLANPTPANPVPLAVGLENAARALDAALAGGATPSPAVRTALAEVTRDLAVFLRGGAGEPAIQLGDLAGRLNTAVSRMFTEAAPGNAPAPASASPIPPAGAGNARTQAQAPAVAQPVPTAPGPVQPVPPAVVAAAEMAGALAGIVHGEIAQVVQPQVLIVASTVAPLTAVPTAPATQVQAAVRPEGARTGAPAPAHDGPLGAGISEEPAAAAPAQPLTAQAVRDAQAPVDVPRILAVLAEAAPAVARAVMAEPPSPQAPVLTAPPAQASGPAVPALPEAVARVLAGAVVSTQARTEPLEAAVARAPQPFAPAAPRAEAPATVPGPVPAVRTEAAPVPLVIPRFAADSYGATTAGGRTANAVPPQAPQAAAAVSAPQPSGVPAQVGRDVVETAVFMHATGLPAGRDSARAAHEYLFGGVRMHEALADLSARAAAPEFRALPAPVRSALEHAVALGREMEVAPEGREVPAQIRGAVEKIGLGHEARLARMAGPEESAAGRQASAAMQASAQESLKSALLDLRSRIESAADQAARQPAMRAGLDGLRASVDDALQVVQAQQVGSFARADSTNMVYVQLPIRFGNELRGGEVHLSWKREGDREGKGGRRDGRAPALMNLNVETRALGPLRVRMQLTGQTLSLVFRVGDPAVQSFLTGEFASLMARLEGFSYKVDRCVAEVGRDEAASEGPSSVVPTSSLDLQA